MLLTKCTYNFSAQEEYLAQLLENNVESERKAVYEKTIEKKERDLLSLRETSKKKLESVDEMISKYRHTMSKQGDLREKNVSALKRLIISNELHFGNMRMFRADVKAKRAKIAYEISNARSELAAKKKEFEALGEKLAKIDCPEVSPSVKKEISESCQKILKDGRKRLLTLKMENRTLWMKLNHNV